MVKIYNRDGTYKEYDEDEVEVITITSDNIKEIKNYRDGVNIYFKDGTIKFLNNANTDGFSIIFE